MNVFDGVTIRPMSWIKAAGYAGALGLLYYSSLQELYFQWSGEEYSYCWFIPFVVLYIIWEKRSELDRLPSSPSWLGLTPLSMGLVLFWLGELGGEYTILYLSLWFVVIGIVWMHIGWQKMRSIAFAFLVMLAMFPLPTFIYTRVTLWAKMISSQLGVWMLHIAGMTAYREGNVIDLGFTQLQVVDACSGLRYIVPIMVFGLLIAYWFKAPLWKKTVLFLSSLPLSIVMNSFRIALTGMLYPILGAAAAEGFFHGFSGGLIFMAAFPFFLAEMWVLNKIPPKEQQSRTPSAAPVDESPPSDAAGAVKQGEGAWTAKLFLQPQFVAGLLLILLTAGISQGVEFRQKIPISRPFNQFPMQVGAWKGSPEVMAPEFRDFLSFSDYLMANYTDQQGKRINLYVAYYQDQRKGESIHSPESCIPMSGWSFTEAGDSIVSLAEGKTSLPVNRAVIEKSGARQLAYYWFPQRGRILTRLYQMKLFTFWDSLTRQRTDGALVRVITPVYDSEQLPDAEQRLQSFTRKIVPVLEGFIPGKDLL